MQLEVQLEIIKWNVVIIWIGLPGTMADLFKQNDIIIRLSTYFREIIKLLTFEILLFVMLYQVIFYKDLTVTFINLMN